MSTFDTLWSAGKVIHGYTMLEDAHEGSNSVWGKARSATGQTVFFKQYKSPSSMFDDWYQGYVDYQKELKRRIDMISDTDANGRNTGPTYRFIEFFEEMGPEGAPAEIQAMEYYQVLEYIDGAKDLKNYLASPDTTWDDRKTFASVFMFAMKTLHGDNVKIIHTDLKPQNVLLIPAVRTDGSATYQVKIIDLDVSILKDKQAPWHDSGSGYIGSPGYYSPEHLRGEVPTEKSDVFTCGLILYEILTQEGHPYGGESDLEVYEEYSAPVPRLLNTYGSPEKDAQIAQMLHRMLDPDPANRPTALEVQRLLISGSAGRRTPPPIRRPVPAETVPAPAPAPAREMSVPAPVPARETSTPVPAPAEAAPIPTPVPAREAAAAVPTPVPAPAGVAPIPVSVPAPAQVAPVPRTFAFCKLKTASAADGIRVFPNSKIGRRFLEALEPEAKKYYSKEHFMILFRDGKWFIKHCAPAGENKTVLNKTLVSGEVELHNGDVIEAASQDGSRTILPLTVEIGG